MVAIRPHPPLSFEHGVQPLCERDHETAHSGANRIEVTCARLLRRSIVRFENEVDVIRLDREVEDPEAVGVGAPPLLAENPQDESKHELCAKRRDGRQSLDRDVQRVRLLVRRPWSMRHPRASSQLGLLGHRRQFELSLSAHARPIGRASAEVAWIIRWALSPDRQPMPASGLSPRSVIAPRGR